MLRKHDQVRPALTVILSVILTTVAGCGGGGSSGGGNSPPPTPPPPPPPSATLTGIQLSQSAVTMDRWGDSVTITAQPTDQAGNDISGATLTWSTADSAIADVDNAGNITSWLGGTVDITVEATLNADTVSNTVSVTVAIQQNSNCTVPAGLPVAGPVSPPNLWDVRRVATQFLPPNANGPVELARQISLDVDRDGDADLVSMKHTPELQGIGVPIDTAHRVWLNDGNGFFSDGTAAILGGNPLPWNAPRDMDYADFDADGFEDVVVFQQGWEQDVTGCGIGGCLGGPNLLLMPEPAGLVDAGPTALSPYDLNGFTHSGAVADVDCDGDADIFEAQWPNADADAPHHLQLNTGAGTFAANDDLLPQELLPDVAVSSSAFCDLDRDGDPDLITGLPNSPTTQFVRISVNNGFGQFRMLDAGILPDISSSDGMDCGDVDLNGFNDIVPSPGASMMLISNQGDMTFTDVTANSLPSNPSVASSTGRSIVDLNGDGWPEITPSNDSAIYWNDGDGTFTKSGIPLLCCGSSFATADFDGDDRPDIYHHFSDTLENPDTLFLNRPAPAPIKLVFATSTLHTADLGGLAGADSICQQRAMTAGLAGDFVALLSDSTTDAMNRISHGEYRLAGDNTLIAGSKMEFTDGLVLSQINQDENGNTIIADDAVRTGTNHQANRREESGVGYCSDWTRATNEDPGLAAFGSAFGLLNDWIWTGDGNCSEPQRLYCFQR